MRYLGRAMTVAIIGVLIILVIVLLFVFGDALFGSASAVPSSAGSLAVAGALPGGVPC